MSSNDTITMFHTSTCPFCERAEALLEREGLAQRLNKVNIERDDALRAEMMSRSGRRTVPQIFIGDRHIGGYDDLVLLQRQGGLAAELLTQG
ncbi:glutaredoxin 3 [Paucibacter sp. APW11]|uniref:Glutaredoxin n=1 Tax=Roseateles aquae TaxID=3077235 RepID=A0ABU3PIG2_9BURK|nr:glutaredoxin 3 [Paucibacter sp. APW11]MDT9002249.1 glutaredoxin 3 [Paucibacter sp. APW11]